ncbi:MAG: efflux RND transporter periplasmic adaptor subunit [Bacteroidales bacterium]|nr:efflux RND transporter periplasmic adaptor subunit [Bacteroidales bacterium]
MRTFTICLFVLLSFLLFRCSPGNSKTSQPDTEAHDHDHEHEHDHEHDHDHDNDHHHEAESSHNHTGVIIFTKAQSEAADLQVETVEPGIFSQVIKTSGQIIASPGDEATLAATANGIVSFGGRSLAPGQAIQRGETLATVSAQRLPEGDPLVKARRAFETAEKEFRRAEDLVKDQIISVKDFDLARLAYENARTVYEAQASDAGSGGLRISSPISGFIKNLLVSQGDYVTVGQAVAVVAKNQRLQLRAEVPENQFRHLHNISSAHFKTAYDTQLHKLSDLNGRFVSSGKAAGDASAFIPVTFEFDNTGEFISGSFAEVFLLSTPRQDVLTVPVSALTEEQGLFFVYLQLEAEEFKKQEVRIGESDGTRVEVLSGIKSGDKVVTHGVVQVKLAATSSVIPEGHTHNH